MSIRLPITADVYDDTVDPNSQIISNTFDPLDDSWPFHQEIQQPEETASQIITRSHDDAYFMGSRTLNGSIDFSEHNYQCFSFDHLGQDDQGITLDKGLKKMKISTVPSPKTRKKLSCSNKNKMRIITGKNVLEQNEEGEGTSNAKKMDHNAKERIRRMKIKASYLALHELLPDSRRSKQKRRSAPFIVDKVLKYIPELEDQIQQLRSKKLNMESERIKNKKIDLIPHESDDNPNNPSSEYQSHTVSINVINQHEVVIQICAVKKEENGSVLLKNLLHILEEEGEGICINSASMLCVCESRICYNLHAQISHTSSSGTERIQELRAKVSSIVAIR